MPILTLGVGVFFLQGFMPKKFVPEKFVCKPRLERMTAEELRAHYEALVQGSMQPMMPGRVVLSYSFSYPHFTEDGNPDLTRPRLYRVTPIAYQQMGMIDDETV